MSVFPFYIQKSVMHRTIRPSAPDDIPIIMQLFEQGRQKMRANGNMEQWINGNPQQKLIELDLQQGNSYIVEEGGFPIATFAFIKGPDITYNTIYEGEWLDNLHPYHVIHRMASIHGVHGIFKTVIDYCLEITTNIRIDTHRQNVIMRNALKKYGFRYCGIIYLIDKSERLAYQYINQNTTNYL